MKPIFTIAFAVAALSTLPACTSMSPQGRSVQVLDHAQPVPAGARFVGRVQTISPLAGLLFQQGSYHNALNKAINDTAERGGDILHLDAGVGARFWGTHQDVRGNAYKR